jgi:hypothetical protein
MNVDELYLTKLLVYGTASPGTDPNTHIRSNTASAPSVTFSMIDYLTTGAGRYAVASSAELVQEFFADSVSSTPLLTTGTYSVAQIQAALGVTGGLSFAVQNYTTDGGSSDYLERAYVFGGSGFSRRIQLQ